MVVFAPALPGSWIFDDHPLIPNNPYVHSWHDWPRWFVTDFWNVDEEVKRFGARIMYWRPAISASYALDWQLGGGQPLMFHITNLVLQGATSVLAFFTLRRWLGSSLPALAAAALFVVHPTKAESVAWIAGRTDIVCMLAVLVATAGIARRLSGRHGGIAMEVAGTLLAYLSKEQAIVLPCFAAVEAWVAADRPSLDRGSLVRMIRIAAPQAGIAIGYLVIRTILMPIGASGGARAHIPLIDHGLAVLETFGRFFALAVVPHDLSIQEGVVHAVHNEHVYAPAYIGLGIATTVLLVAVAVWTRRRAPVVTVGIALYFTTIAPTSNLVYTGIQTLISERFLFLPLLGLALVVGALVGASERRWGRRVYAVVVIAVLALGVVSARRSADYRDEHRFWARELVLHPDSIQARSAAVDHDVEARRLYPALALLQPDTKYDASIDEHLRMALRVAELLSLLVPDHAVHDLEAIDQFCAHLVAKQPARLEMLGVVLELDLARIASDASLVQARPQFVRLRSELQSRLGHDAAAIELARAALAECETCGTLITNDALVLARAGHYDESLAVLDAASQRGNPPAIAAARASVESAQQLFEQAQRLQGPAALQAHASELAKLELWGRAFDLLAPYEAEIVQAPRFATGFAELAFRAGEPVIARRVLASGKSDTETDALIAEWTAKMGWTR
jgi:hypothetical protein